MRLSVKTGLVVLTVLSVTTFFSCVTTPAPVTAPEQPAARNPAEKPAQKAFTRIGFAEELQNLLSGGKFDQAIALFDTVPETEASDLSILQLKLSVLISARKIAEASALANDLETKNPGNTEILYKQAILAGARNDSAARTKYLNQVLQLDPVHCEALTAVGLDLFSKKNYPQAKISLIKAVSADPSNTDALLGLARVYYMQNDLGKAGDTLNLALQKDQTNSDLWAERARVKSETNDLPGALEDIAKAIELDPDVYSHRIDQGTYLISAAKKKEARDAFSQAIRIDPNQYLAYIYRAGLNDDLENTDEAISDYKNVCHLIPDYYYAAEALGILLWGKDDYAGSREAFTQALSFNPKNVPYALMITLCLYREGKEAEAKSFMLKYSTTIDREKTEYMLCRLFSDRSGDADVLNRITKEKNINQRNRMLFYTAMYYDLFQSKTLAQKYYLEILSATSPSFFEYRLSKWALRDLENAGQKGTVTPAQS